MHIETIGVTATAPGASGAAAAAVAGDSLIVKNGKRPRILNTWADFQGTGWMQIVFPTGHDTTRNWRNPVVASEVTSRMPFGLAMDLTPQEQMAITFAGSATSGDIENACLLMAYDEMPGSEQHLMSWDEVERRAYKLTTVQYTLDITAGGAWNGSEAINADSDLLLANRNYALIGIELQTECCAVSIKGPDTAGVRMAVPGSTEFADQSSQYFGLLSRAFGNLKCIPVINSANKANTLLEGLQDENIADITASLQLVLLT